MSNLKYNFVKISTPLRNFELNGNVPTDFELAKLKSSLHHMRKYGLRDFVFNNYPMLVKKDPALIDFSMINDDVVVADETVDLTEDADNEDGDNEIGTPDCNHNQEMNEGNNFRNTRFSEEGYTERRTEM
mgnify:CR=1 FL=1